MCRSNTRFATDRRNGCCGKLLYRHVPRELIERPKMGFGVPIGDWLKGPLRDWAEALLNERRLRDEGYLRPGPIRRMWQSHLSGSVMADARLWTVLMFQRWLEEHDADFRRIGTTTASGEDSMRISLRSQL